VQQFPSLQMSPSYALAEIRRAGLTQHRDVTRHFSMLERAAEANTIRHLPDLRPVERLIDRAHHCQFESLLPAFSDRAKQILSIDPPYV
jgi:hypothetical protein